MSSRTAVVRWFLTIVCIVVFWEHPCSNALVAFGVDVTVEWEGNCPIYAACEQGHVDIVRTLLDAGVNPNYRNSSGDSLLYVSVFHTQLGVAALLLEKGADPDADVSGFTCLAVATAKQNAHLCRLLINYGADVNLAPGIRSTRPLRLACRGWNAELVGMLLGAGADPNATKMVIDSADTILGDAGTCSQETKASYPYVKEVSER